MALNETIDLILKERREQRLPLVEERLEFLRKARRSLVTVGERIGGIRCEIEQQHGTYFAILDNDPAMRARFEAVNTGDTLRAVDDQIARLEMLRGRFGREAVQIAFVGEERQGKSRFLQSMTGLDNRVIPAFDGDSCTGAVSIIHNHAGQFRAHLVFFSRGEFVDVVNSKLKRYFPAGDRRISEPEDLRTLEVDDFDMRGDFDLEADFKVFVQRYIGQFDDYCEYLLDREHETDLSDQNLTAEFVAQYEIVADRPDGPYEEERDAQGRLVYKKMYCKYVTIKRVDIFTQFPTLGEAKVILCDTVGLGGRADNEVAEREMFRVLREDCDAAIDVFMPRSAGGVPGMQRKIFTKIGQQLADRDTTKWMYYVVNRRQGINDTRIPAIMQELQQSRLESIFAQTCVIDASESKAVNDNLLMPILDMIQHNLCEIDNGLLAQADSAGRDLYLRMGALCDSMEEVVSGGMQQNTNEWRMFDNLFRQLKDTLSGQLNELEDSYAQNRENPCDEVAESIDRIADTILDLCPAKEDIEAQVRAHIQNETTIYVACLDAYSNAIYSAFESMSHDVLFPLQEEVKDCLIAVLREHGRMGRVRLSDNPENNQEWLRLLMAEKVKADQYPQLAEILEYILQYRISIDGAMEYRVYGSTRGMDKFLNPQLPPIDPASSAEERAEVIWGELVVQGDKARRDVKRWSVEFAKIPSYSFYARVHKFIMKLVHGDQATADCLTDFYRDNHNAIWREDFQNLVQRRQAFGDWNAACHEVRQLCELDEYRLQNL